MPPLHTLNQIPPAALPITATVANVLTILSMAVLGIGVNVRVVVRAGVRVKGAVVASLLLLGGVQLRIDPRPGRHLRRNRSTLSHIGLSAPETAQCSA